MYGTSLLTKLFTKCCIHCTIIYNFLQLVVLSCYVYLYMEKAFEYNIHVQYRYILSCPSKTERFIQDVLSRIRSMEYFTCSLFDKSDLEAWNTLLVLYLTNQTLKHGILHLIVISQGRP